MYTSFWNTLIYRLNNLLQEIGDNIDKDAKVIIFVETKRKVEDITRAIRKFGWPAVCMHGDKSQQERDYVLRQFRNGKSSILVATDVAARGLGEFAWKVSRSWYDEKRILSSSGKSALEAIRLEN